MLYGADKPLQKQIEILHEILKYNAILYEIIKDSPKLCMENYYIGAGCINQTIWNYQNGNAPMLGINDVDFIYYDEDLSYESESEVINKVQDMFQHLPIEIDIKNQARVHLWYKEHFGYALEPLLSIQSAVNIWLPVTAIGVRLMDETLEVYAPYGLNDIFTQTVRPNKIQIPKEYYETKVKKWSELWPNLKIIPW